MCVICSMIDKSLPNPKSLIQSLRELNIDEDHEIEVLDKVYDKIPQGEQMEYIQQVANEGYLDFLRNT